jgi:hypothetical protein
MALPIKSIVYVCEAIAANPFPLGTSGYWTRLSDGHPMFTNLIGVSYDLLA